MAFNDLEILAKALLNTPNGAKVLANMDKISEILNRPEGKELVKMVAGDGGEALKRAAKSALEGDKDVAKQMISSLLSSKEGAELAKQVIALVNQKK